MGVDTLIAALIEFDLVLTDLRALADEPQRILQAALARDAHIGRLGPGGPWRDWLSPAETQPYAFDELPELVLPERLIARLTPSRSLNARVRLRHTRRAGDLACRPANGRTLESSALRRSTRARHRHHRGGAYRPVARLDSPAVASSESSIEQAQLGEQPSRLEQHLDRSVQNTAMVVNRHLIVLVDSLRSSHAVRCRAERSAASRSPEDTLEQQPPSERGHLRQHDVRVVLSEARQSFIE